MVWLGPVDPSPTCERCGAALEIDWCEISGLGSAEPEYVPGRAVCPTPDCGKTCPICRRWPGDIHSGACGPIMERKLIDKVHVSREDCMTPRTGGLISGRPVLAESGPPGLVVPITRR